VNVVAFVPDWLVVAVLDDWLCPLECAPPKLTPIFDILSDHTENNRVRRFAVADTVIPQNALTHCTHAPTQPASRAIPRRDHRLNPLQPGISMEQALRNRPQRLDGHAPESPREDDVSRPDGRAGPLDDNDATQITVPIDAEGFRIALKV
jgi:hypothetical protein